MNIQVLQKAVFLANSFICDFITSLARLTVLDLVLYKSEYFILSCIGLNNEHRSSFVGVTEGEANIETYESLNVEILPLLLRLWCPLLYSELTYWSSFDAGNILSIPTPSCNPLYIFWYKFHLFSVYNQCNSDSLIQIQWKY